MTKSIILFNIISIFFLKSIKAEEKNDYGFYHKQVIAAETLIASEKYSEALQVYESLFDNYTFIFVREYQIATQLALNLNETKKAAAFLRKGVLAGWQIKSIKQNNYLSKFRATNDWKLLKKEYPNLKKKYESSLNEDIRKQVKKMFSKDQWKAMGALFRFSSKAQDSYAEKKFAPQSEKQLSEFLTIYGKVGYPGEKCIGNDYWMSTILSHHNSISHEYVAKDTLYPILKPTLIEALKKGQISPFEFALIDEWYRSIKNDKNKITYGIINPPSKTNLLAINKLRKIIFLRPIEIRNKLVEVQKKTGMNFYLKGSPWIKGKIEIK